VHPGDGQTAPRRRWQPRRNRCIKSRASEYRAPHEHRRRYAAGVAQLLRLVAVLTLLFLLLPLLDVRVRGRTNRTRYVQIVIVSILLLAFLIFGRRWT